MSPLVASLIADIERMLQRLNSYISDLPNAARQTKVGDRFRQNWTFGRRTEMHEIFIIPYLFLPQRASETSQTYTAPRDV